MQLFLSKPHRKPSFPDGGAFGSLLQGRVKRGQIERSLIFDDWKLVGVPAVQFCPSPKFCPSPSCPRELGIGYPSPSPLESWESWS